MMRLTCLGSGQTVTGSKYYLESETTSLVIDCGLYQGDDVTHLNLQSAGMISNRKIDAVILTHAHLDHIGFLPRLVRQGYQGKIFATEATKKIAEIIWRDNAAIMSHRRKKNDPAFEEKLYYTDQDIKKTLAHTIVKDFHEDFSVGDFKLHFIPAGHILGAASCLVSLFEKTVLFSGDLGRFEDVLIRPADFAPQADYIVMESTYGDRDHPVDDFEYSFEEILNSIKGTLLIPAFALGRSQTIMYKIWEYFQKYPEQEIPVYIDSPMMMSITELYLEYPDQQIKDLAWLKEAQSQFKWMKFPKQRKKLEESTERKIILSASGMLSGGHIVGHLQTYLEDPNSGVILTGYQAQGTLGAELQTQPETVQIEAKTYAAQCQIFEMTQFSSHQDRDELLKWLSICSPQKIYLTHGEPDSLKALETSLSTAKNCPVESLVLNHKYSLN